MDRNIVIAVDANDTEIGYYDKMQAHEEGILHRAVSVLIFNTKGEWLLQQRAANKYHCGSLWSNTACSHPMKGEVTTASAERRLQEEMGITLKLEKIFSFTYRAEFDNGLIEHELDHVYIGYTDNDPITDPTEVADFRWLDTAALEAEIDAAPENFTPWFRLLVPKVKEHLKDRLAV